MVVEHILGKLTKTDKRIDTITLEWFEHEKKRMRKTTSAGEEMGISVDVPLEEGDILAEDDTRIVVVEYAPCDLIKIPVHSMKEMGKLCFEIGNRHLSLSIEDDMVKIPFDEPMFLYLAQLGFHPERACEKLMDVTVCKAHGHSHSHEHSHDHHHE